MSRMTTCKSCGSMMEFNSRWVTLYVKVRNIDHDEVGEDEWFCIDCGLNKPILGAVPIGSVPTLLYTLGLGYVLHAEP